MMSRFKPHILMLLVQTGYTFLYFITEASFHHGLNTYVYITYRHFVATLVFLPFAYFLERYIIYIYIIELCEIDDSDNIYIYLFIYFLGKRDQR